MSAPETQWRVFTLPRTDGIEFSLTLSTPTTEPEIIAAIESAAQVCGMVIRRLEAVSSTDEAVQTTRGKVS